ncbi:MAG: ribonuclease [Clostridia bacterium]|nr:ribonuclease [Clostridia bacterium]
MKNIFKRIAALSVLAAVVFSLVSCAELLDLEVLTDGGLSIITEGDRTAEPAKTTQDGTEQPGAPTDTAQSPAIDENGTYTSKDDVALYVHTYGKLPSNFITKEEAQDLGWSGGSLEDYAKGKSIGGDRFGNYEGKLPKAKGRTYTECDIDTLGAKSRGAKRIVFSNDGLIFYTEDHYETFVQLY